MSIPDRRWNDSLDMFQHRVLGQKIPQFGDTDSLFYRAVLQTIEVLAFDGWDLID